MASVWTELKRRNVVKVGVAYAVVGWLLVEIASTVLPTFQAPQWVLQTVTFVIVLGFPLALILSRAFELTPQGLKRERTISAGEDVTGKPIATERSIAVLPFVNMSSDPEQEYFSDGIAEELLNQLSKLRGLHVAGRTSSFFFKNKSEDLRVIGEKLNVAHILEGSVRKSGDRVRITAQLVKTSDGYHLWSETFDRNLDDIFAIQDETAKAVADALSVALGVGETARRAGGTRNVEAYDSFLAGRSLSQKLGRESVASAMELLEKATRLDPEFADAWSYLAELYWTVAQVGMPEKASELVAKYEDAVARAVDLAPDSVSGLLAAARGQSADIRDWQSAEENLKKALTLESTEPRANAAYGVLLLGAGRPREGRAYLQRSFRAEPLWVYPAINLGVTHELSGNLDQALKQYRLALTLPGDHGLIYGIMTALAMAMDGTTGL